LTGWGFLTYFVSVVFVGGHLGSKNGVKIANERTRK